MKYWGLCNIGGYEILGAMKYWGLWNIGGYENATIGLFADMTWSLFGLTLVLFWY